jgi:hypothetical protein
MTKQHRPIAPLVLVTVGLTIALGLRPTSVREILAAYVLALAAIALLTLARLAHSEDAWERATSELERALTPGKPVWTRPAELIRVERDIVLGTTNAGHFHARLRPVLSETAAARLAARHSVDLGRQPDAARRLLGAEVWEVVRPDREAPADLYEPGLSIPDLRRVVESLESL